MICQIGEFLIQLIAVSGFGRSKRFARFGCSRSALQPRDLVAAHTRCNGIVLYANSSACFSQEHGKFEEPLGATSFSAGPLVGNLYPAWFRAAVLDARTPACRERRDTRGGNYSVRRRHFAIRV